MIGASGYGAIVGICLLILVALTISTGRSMQSKRLAWWTAGLTLPVLSWGLVNLSRALAVPKNVDIALDLIAVGAIIAAFGAFYLGWQASGKGPNATP